MPLGEERFAHERASELRDTAFVSSRWGISGRRVEFCAALNGGLAKFAGVGGEHGREADAPVRWRGQCIRRNHTAKGLPVKRG